MANPLTWYRQLHVFFKCVVIFLGTVALAAGIFFFNVIFIGTVTQKTMDPIEKADVLLEQSIESLPKPPRVPQTYMDVVKAQHSIMKQRKEHHWKLARLFFRNYYSILFLKMILACIGAIVLFAVINKGWSNVNLALQTFFLTIATALIFVGFFPVVFKQQDNFTQNMTYYENYEKGELAIFNQLSTLQNPFSTPDSAALYHRLDSLVKVNNDYLTMLTMYVLTIDPEESQKITINEVLKQLQSYSKPVVDTNKRH